MSDAPESDIGVGIRRDDDETWLACVIRMAAPYGLEEAVTEEYHDLIAAGRTEEEAALGAAMEWDVAIVMRGDA